MGIKHKVIMIIFGFKTKVEPTSKVYAHWYKSEIQTPENCISDLFTLKIRLTDLILTQGAC